MMKEVFYMPGPKLASCRCRMRESRVKSKQKTHAGRAYWSRIGGLLGPVPGLQERLLGYVDVVSQKIGAPRELRSI